MLTIDDLPIINAALEKGADIRVQNTPDGGYRILSDTVKVLKATNRARPRVDGDGYQPTGQFNQKNLVTPSGRAPISYPQK